MLDVASKAFFQTLSHSRTLKTLASRYGMSGTARVRAALHRRRNRRRCDRRGSPHTVAGTPVHARLSWRKRHVAGGGRHRHARYLQLIDAVDRAGVERNLSLKLTQLGLDVDRAICVDNLRKILTAADQCGFFVRIDMESSAYTDATLDIFETVWKLGHRNVGVVLQSCLYRTEKDFERVNALGARIRLVKGAYREPKSVAYQLKSDVDAAYVRLAKRLLTEGMYPAIATHDEDILNEVKRFAPDRAISPDAYEFQMLYGIRRDLQNALSRRRLSRARVCALRPRMVSLLHAPARRTAGQRRLRGPQPLRRTLISTQRRKGAKNSFQKHDLCVSASLR